MTFYFLIFGVLALFSFLEIFGLKKIDNIVLFSLLSFFLFSLSFLRWETGTDWDAYLDFFNGSTEWFTIGEFEWGYSRINEFVKIFFNNYTFLLFVLAVILFSFQSKAILNFSPYPITSLLILWSTTYANVFFVRQTVATAILFFSIKYIQEKKFWFFLSMIGLAMLFHRTSIVFIFAWWIYKLKLRPLTLVLYVVASFCLSVVLGKIFESLGEVAGGIVQQKIDYYLSDSENTFGGKTPVAEIIMKGFANKIFIFAIVTSMLKKITKNEPEFQGYFNLYWAGVVLYFSTVSLSIVLVRLSLVYDMVLIIIIPLVLKYTENTYGRFLLYIMFVFYLLARFYTVLTGNYIELFVPFKTIFG
ncbi:EpsG family protein [Flavobacterium sp. ZT3R17]|uniref:EpsG family protein n=1 Tax=Flavobacterium cryoconiti TaxID=3398736 RepID=UPI003A88FF96